MADMLKALPFLTVEDYLWGYSSSFIKLMAYDQSRVKYLSTKEVERRKQKKENERNAVYSAEDVFAHLGIANTPKAQVVTGDWMSKLVKQEDKQ